MKNRELVCTLSALDPEAEVTLSIHVENEFGYWHSETRRLTEVALEKEGTTILLVGDHRFSPAEGLLLNQGFYNSNYSRYEEWWNTLNRDQHRSAMLMARFNNQRDNGLFRWWEALDTRWEELGRAVQELIMLRNPLPEVKNVSAPQPA